MKSYGIDVAASSGLPSDMIQHAHVLRARLDRSDANEQSEQSDEARRAHHSASSTATIATRLDALRHSTLNNDAIRSYLQQLQQEFAQIVGVERTQTQQ